MNNVCEGIVVRVQEYKDNDMIVGMYTKEYGMLSFYAKGIRKSQSKNAYALSLYAQSRIYFNYYENKEIYSLKTAEKIGFYRHLYDSLTAQAVAALICEIAQKLNCEYYEKFYQLLSKCLENLNSGHNEYGVLGFFVARCCEFDGITPNADRCVICENSSSIATISLRDGGFICSRCFDPMKHKKCDIEMMRTFRIMVKSSFDDLDLVLAHKIYPFKEIEMILRMFVEYSGISLKSLKFLEKIS